VLTFIFSITISGHWVFNSLLSPLCEAKKG
jgi:hypothetical protein